MFYSQFILAKKGPLGTIWIAAHLERKLRKNQVADTDIGVSVDSILSPDVPIALRLSSHLLVGVVRIYSRKVNYLFDDCSETLLKIKQAFRSAAVDLPPEESKAPYHSITLPETFELDDFELPDNDIFQGNFVDHHISSREQITLQDSMDGVTYSTSKFGLDERFGDGDASGLDLDEELFLDKLGTAGHSIERSDPQSSVRPMTPLKQDEHPETRVDGVDDYADLMDYAQAPCTPGLVEEPNFSNVQEVSTCDDHQETEYHLGESTVNENSKNNIYGDKQDVDWSSRNHTNSDEIHVALLEECGLQSGGLHSNLSKQHEESPLEANMEDVQIETSSGSKPPDLSGQVKPLEPVSEVPCMEDLQNEAANEDNNSSLPVDKPSDHHQGPNETVVEKSACEISGSPSTCDQVSEGLLTKDHGSTVVEVCGTVEMGSDWEKQLPDASELPSRNQDGFFPQDPETQAFHEPADPSSLNLDINDKVPPSETFVLRPCNSRMEMPDISCGVVMSTDAGVQSDVTGLATSEREETVMIGKGCSGTHHSEENWKENHIKEHTLQEEIHAPSSELDNQVMNASAHDRLIENLNNSAEAELPAPEKLLSVPEDVDQQRNMLPEATPGVDLGLDEGDAGSKMVSGKKRSFTESTLTEQSLNSVESSGLVRFKRTIDSMPDDDDLLSSILVGRSSVLKVKPTPRLSEATSTKRTRSAPRTGAPKRKVLMDDTMVLHGDMIRQQLTSTEDIRRVRKKAPCTLHEISMIQKQHLDDDIILAPLFTGISTELMSLHSQMHDLRGITVCKDDLVGASLEIDADLRLPSDNVPSTYDKDVSFETMAEPVLSSHDVQNDVSVASATEPHLLSQNIENAEILNMGSDKGSEEPNVAEQGEVIISEPLSLDRDSEAAKSSENPQQSNNRMIEGDEITVEVNTGEEQTKPTSDVGPMDDKNDDAPCPSASVDQMNPTMENSEMNTSLNADTLACLPDQENTAPSIELDYAVTDVDNGQAIRSDELAARDRDIDAMFETEPLVRNMDNGQSISIDELAAKDCHIDAMFETEPLVRDVDNGQSISIDELAAKDCNIDAMFETEPLVRDGVLSDMARDSTSFELLLSSKQGELEYDERCEIHSAMLGETIVDSSCPADIGRQDNGFMDNSGSAEQPEAYQQHMMEADAPFDLNELEELDYAAAGNDTEFLNVDDDDLTEMADDDDDDEEARFTENTGWSSRTRAVSKYLQTLFAKEAGYGRKPLSIDSLLIGKSRKEASRMFFEALVLKTRDYIHVEQPNPFDAITIQPRTRLMKSDF